MDLTPIIQAVILLLSTVITAVVVPWIKSNVSKTTQDRLYAAVDIAVHAAEQLGGLGADKKKFVIQYLESKGFKVDDIVIEGMVNKYLKIPEAITVETVINNNDCSPEN